MTRESVPRFDLYEELQVARHASTEVIEAAFRYLVKRHRPDAASAVPDERLRRLNLAREWLTDPGRRRRYDAAADAALDRPGTPADAPRRVPNRPPATRPSYGPNASEVRSFLVVLRTLDWDRALQVWEDRDPAHAEGHAAASRKASAAALGPRHEAWNLARAAAIGITRAKLGASTVTAQVAELAADAAGAIAIRDRLPPRDYIILTAPWRRAAKLPPTEAVAAVLPVATPVMSPIPQRPGAVPVPAAAPIPAAAPAAGAARVPAVQRPAAAPAAAPHAAARVTRTASLALSSVDWRTAWTRLARGRAGASPAVPAGALVVALVVLAIGISIQSRPTLGLGDPGASHSSSASPGAVAVAPGLTLPPPLPSFPPLLPTEAPTPGSPRATLPPLPGATQTTGGVAGTPAPPGPTAPPGATVGPTPTSAGPTTGPTETPASTVVPPTLPPTLPPVPDPTPTEVPTATPAPLCAVPNLVGETTNKAIGLWRDRGFTGGVIFDPTVPPHYPIGWQSLAPESIEPCSSDITVRDQAP